MILQKYMPLNILQLTFLYIAPWGKQEYIQALTVFLGEIQLNLFTKEKVADNWGIAISFICAIHCLTLPFVAIASPLVSKIIGNPLIHVGLFVALLPISFVAFVRQRREHQKSTPSILAVIGLIFLLVGLIIGLEHDHQHFDFHAEELISVVGSVFLIYAHFLNIKHLKNCRKCCHH